MKLRVDFKERRFSIAGFAAAPNRRVCCCAKSPGLLLRQIAGFAAAAIAGFAAAGSWETGSPG